MSEEVNAVLGESLERDAAAAEASPVDEAVLGEQARRSFDNVVASAMPSTGEPGFALFGAGLAALGGVGLWLRRIGRRH
jgi:LPXTG-motif cell wall-anchored protein